MQATLAPGVLPRPGVYVYAQTGYERAKLGPLTIRRKFPAQALLVVSGTGHVVQTEWRYSKQHLEATRVRVTPTGSYTLWQRTRLQLIVTDDEAHATVPVTLSLPARLHVGQAWTQRYSVNGITTVSRNRIVRRADARGQAGVRRDRGLRRHRRPSRAPNATSTGSTPPPASTCARRSIGRSEASFPYEMHVDVRFLRKR